MQEKKPNEGKFRLCCVLAYFWVLFFLPLVFFKDDERARFHANQGLVLLITMAIINAVLSLLYFLFTPVVQNALYTIANLLGIAMSILGVLHVCNEQLRPLPIIGGIKIIK